LVLGTLLLEGVDFLREHLVQDREFLVLLLEEKDFADKVRLIFVAL
jgi:hypothetical protein